MVIVSGIAQSQYASTEQMAEAYAAYAMVSLVEQGWADQNQVARAFGCSVRTVRRHQRRFENGGLAALGHRSGYLEGRRRLPSARTQLIERLKADGHSNREIARRVGVSEMAIRKMLRRLGWQEPSAEPISLSLDLGESAKPEVAASATVQSQRQPAPTGNPSSQAKSCTAALPPSCDTDPMNRSGVRLMVP